MWPCMLWSAYHCVHGSSCLCTLSASACIHALSPPYMGWFLFGIYKWPQLGMRWTFQKLGHCQKKSEVSPSFLLSFSSSVPGHSLLTKTRIFFVTVLSELTIIWIPLNNSSVVSLWNKLPNHITSNIGYGLGCFVKQWQFIFCHFLYIYLPVLF